MGNPSDDDRQVQGTFREVFLDRLVPERDCGSCVACCKILEINQPELKKPSDVLCQHNTGTGCGIYLSRPAICRTWYCLWRRIAEMPDFTRPDKIGVVFSIDRHNPPRNLFEQLYIVARTINGPHDLLHPEVKAIIEMFVDEGTLPIWVSHDGEKKLIYPFPELVGAILNPTTATPPSLLAQAAIWRERWEIK
jgi:hypothetical protein